MLESPDIWHFEFKADPASHVILTAINPRGKEQFYTGLNASMAITHEAFIFIHGYNVTFEDAARRTAQIAYDLNFQGAPIFYSWPSRGTTLGYAADEESIQLSTERIKDFIEKAAALTNAQTIHLIAHSMGNRGLTAALIEMSTELPTDQRQKINQIVLAAPDINAEIFKEQIAPRIVPLGQQITLYVSSRDVALSMSKWFHSYARIGESGSNLVLISGIQTIDASNVNSDLFNHSYPFAMSVLADIYELFRHHDFPKDRFNLEPVETATGRYWRFRHNQ
jgi:esterase/lipase superfamily enzyme